MGGFSSAVGERKEEDSSSVAADLLELLQDFVGLTRLVALVAGVEDFGALGSTTMVFTVVGPTSTPSANSLPNGLLRSTERSGSMRTSLDTSPRNLGEGGSVTRLHGNRTRKLT